MITKGVKIAKYQGVIQLSFCDTVEDAVKDQDTTLMCTIAHACLHLELGFFYGNPCENFETLLNLAHSGSRNDFVA